MLDATDIIAASEGNDSDLPVTTAKYFLEVVMNENHYDIPDVEHIKQFEDEFQRALDAGYFTDLRYDAMKFKVISRIALCVSLANG